MRLGLLFLCFLSWTASADKVRYVFKGPLATSISAYGQLSKMSFGLTDHQAQQILDLTEGQVNFGDVYYLERERGQLSQLLSNPSYVGFINPAVPPPFESEVIQGDPELQNEWWIGKLGIKTAWHKATGRGVTIADCDAGFYHDEVDLSANMLMEHRYDLSDKDDPLTINDGPYAFHGTAVAAIMTGVMNGVGTSGIAFNSKLVPLQNFNYHSKDDLDKEEATAACVLRAIQTPNVSIIVVENQTENGSSETFIGTRDAIRLAVKSGLIVVTAAGNSGAHLTTEEKDDTGSIIVGAVMPNELPTRTTNFGKRVTISAFGADLKTLYGPNGKLGNFGGTSGATPQVAATVALMKEAYPHLTPAQARRILTDSRHMRRETRLIGGRLNAAVAVKRAQDMGSVELDNQWAEQWLFRQQLVSILKNP